MGGRFKKGENGVTRGYLTQEQQVEACRKAGRASGMKNTFQKILSRECTADDVILKCRRKMPLGEAVLLKLFEAAMEGKPWAIEKVMKEGMHDGADKVEVSQGLSPAAQAILGGMEAAGEMVDITPSED